MLVSAAARTHSDGLPFVRRCDLEWFEEVPADVLHSQYLLGDDLLVAPVDPFKGDGGGGDEDGCGDEHGGDSDGDDDDGGGGE